MNRNQKLDIRLFCFINLLSNLLKQLKFFLQKKKQDVNFVEVLFFKLAPRLEIFIYYNFNLYNRLNILFIEKVLFNF